LHGSHFFGNWANSENGQESGQSDQDVHYIGYCALAKDLFNQVVAEGGQAPVQAADHHQYVSYPIYDFHFASPPFFIAPLGKDDICKKLILPIL
jgi:hypothetical protein